ncbi:type II toxin-antitoxin system ParD family antitoxin [Mesorhizobium sp. J428]|uniref:type II toxin-antitoxin system ParD family antitoxin n=1 Tax=Mesorhizobium sp. J428 TaxID=2898440 RepID=UPI0021511D36|nr:type II toxin-antitoxin system ParD family antitoxin [Mesorhizobium sp. J428]MCR5858479.1 type II toxin-antitoxin system ParD family antitoxin [Mesorhizobium sp. J428]
MNVSVGPKWEAFVAEAVESGRYGSASEIVREGLRLVEEREAKLAALRQMIEASIAEGGDYSDEDIEREINERAEILRRQGF